MPRAWRRASRAPIRRRWPRSRRARAPRRCAPRTSPATSPTAPRSRRWRPSGACGAPRGASRAWLTPPLPSSDAAPHHSRHRRRLRRRARPRITRGLVRVLGDDQITHFCTDDYHRYDREQRAEREHHAAAPRLQPPRHPRAAPAPPAEREPIMKPVYRTPTARSRPPDYFVPAQFVVAEGLLGSPHPSCATCLDVRVYLDPPEDLRRHWKVQRDCSRRGYTTDQVLARARPARAGLRGVHPPAAAPRRHRRLVPCPATRGEPGAPRLRS